MHQKPWFKTPLYVTGLAVAAILLVSFLTPALRPVLDAFISYWGLIWWAILLGLGIAGVIDALVPDTYIMHYLARPGRKSIFYATVLGFIMSACSHGILAIAMGLFKKGASTAAVVAFLLASPWANLAITFMLIGFFGLKALFFIAAAIIIALITGFTYQALERKGFVESNPNKALPKSGFSVRRDVSKRWNLFKWSQQELTHTSISILKGSWHVAHMVVWWVLIGTMIGSFIEAFVPKNLMQEYMGPTMLGLGVTLIVATIIEVCSEGSAPIAFTIYKQTGAFGNAFVFLMAGVITDITELGLIWSNIGRKAAIWLPIITVPQALLVAWFFNQLF